MDIYEAIKGRRSIRKFKPDPVPKNVLEKALEMATWAPSGVNRQNWYFVVIGGNKKDGLVEIAGESYEYAEPVLKEVFKDRPRVVVSTEKFFRTLGGAPVVIVAYYEPTRERPETCVQTVAAAIENLLLAIYAQGLGACWMTGPLHVSEKIDEFLGVENKTLVAVIPVGYPDQSPPAPKRRLDRVVYEGL